MYKLLIADDDPNIRIGMRTMIEREFGDEIAVYTSENGYEAFEQVKKIGIHMIITDIKMPIWTGLDLISHLKEIKREIPTVVLSGYDDYNLVRSALKEGVEDYLLKPINEGLLIHTIRAMMQGLDLRVEQELEHADKGEEKQILLEEFLDSALWKEEQISAYRDQNQISDETLCSLIYVELPVTLYAQKQKWKSYMEKKTVKFVEQYGLAERAVYGEAAGLYSILIFIKDDMKGIQQGISEFITYLSKDGYKVSGAENPCPLKNLSFLKAECNKGLERFYFDLPYRNVKADQPKKEIKKALEDLTEALKQYDCGSAIKHLTRAFELYNSYPPMIAHVQKELIGAVYEVMQKNAAYIGIIGQSKFTEYDIFDQIQNSKSLSSLQKCLIETMNYYVQKTSETLNNREDFAIRKAKKYVEDNLSDQVTLVDVAAYVYLNPSYFSTLFKTKTGMNFRNYLRECRVERAKELLQENELKIYEIAEQVGYQEAAHFVRAFKEVTGQSPIEYRNNLTAF